MTESPKTAAEWLRELNQDPEFRARKEREEAELQRRREERAVAEEPLVRELRARGFNVESVWDLVGTREPYPEALPVLIDHLTRPYPPKIREGIGRALAVRVLDSSGWELVRRQFLEERDSEAKWALALVLKVNAGPHHVDALIRLLEDSASGKGRAVFAEALYSLDGPGVQSRLEDLVADEEIGSSVRRLLRTGSIWE